MQPAIECASGATTAGADLDQDMLGKALDPNGAARLDWESAKEVGKHVPELPGPEPPVSGSLAGPKEETIYSQHQKCNGVPLQFRY